MRMISGQAKNVDSLILGQITKDRVVNPFNSNKIYCSESEVTKMVFGHIAFITSIDKGKSFKTSKPVILVDKEECDYFHIGDVVKIFPSGQIMKLWDVHAQQNALFITDRCDSKCIMCPQPPKVRDSFDYRNENLSILNMVKNQLPERLCLTGGEPFLDTDQCCEIISFCKNELPDTSIIILTNARRLSNFENMKKIAHVGNKNVLFAVSLHADVNTIHDSIVGVKGAFNEALKGIHNLARFKQMIEIRFVISSLNYERIPSMSEFIYRNFPYVTHVAFMGLEYTGEASVNWKKIIIDPPQYSRELTTSVRNLYRRDMGVSIYNVPLCLLPKELWNFARDSISTWKKTYLTQCSECRMQQQCCGVFATSMIHSENIKPITD